jgi:uncharacterized protein (TIGR00251 family)
MSPIRATTTGVRIQVSVQPRASRTEIAGLHGDAVKIRLAAPPVDGAANDALVDFLAEALQVPRSSVAITAGHSARRKVVTVDGLTSSLAAQRLHLGE